MTILERALSPGMMLEALAVAQRNEGAAGADGVSVAQFVDHAASELEALRMEVLAGAWHPRPARRVNIPKSGGGYRTLAIGAVRDRVVQHAVARALSEALDDRLHPAAFAWRKGKSTRDALAAVESLLAQGRHWVLRSDIEDFFDRIPRDRLLRCLHDATQDGPLVDLVHRMLDAGAFAGPGLMDPHVGTAQGNPLSPFLANLYLAPFDQAMTDDGSPLVRYGDDFAVCVFTRREAEHALDHARLSLHRLGLALNARKTLLRSLGEGFTFLGFDFHAAGRRPSDKAARQLSEAAARLTRESSGAASMDALLRGWVTYFGTFSNVALPPAVRARAEALELASAERAQFGALEAPKRSRPSPAIPEAPSTADSDASSRAAAASPTPARAPHVADRWSAAAARLSPVVGTADEARVSEALQHELQIPDAAWPRLRAALVEGTTETLAERLAEVGRYGDAEAVRAAAADAPPAQREPPRGPLPEVRPEEEVPPATTVAAEPPAGSPAPTPAPGDSASSGDAVPTPEDAHEPPRFDASLHEAQRLLDLFPGAEHVHLREARVGANVSRERVALPLTAERIREHLRGDVRVGVFPLRADGTVLFGAARLVVAKAVSRAKDAPEPASPSTAAAETGVDPRVAAHATRILKMAARLGLSTLTSLEPGRGVVVWFPLEKPAGAARVQALLATVFDRAGPCPQGLTREVFPAQTRVIRDHPGTGILLPLGRDARSGGRAWFLDASMRPADDMRRALAECVPNPTPVVDAALGGPPKADAPTAAPATPTPAETPAPSDALSPFREHPRAQAIHQGCAVLRTLVERAVAGAGLEPRQRYVVTDVLGRLGDESVGALDAVFRHLDDWKPGMAARHIARLYPNPASCGRIREQNPQLTARVGCSCRFRAPPGVYPTPVLHALGAAEVPALAERMHAAASAGGLSRAARTEEEAHRKALGERATALVARMADLRKQLRHVERTLEQVEKNLDALVDEAGDIPLETPSGTLRRETVGGTRRFVVDV